MSCSTGDLPLTYDIYAPKGDTYRRGVRIKNQVTNTYEDLTGVVLAGQVRSTLFDTTDMFDLTLAIDPDQVTNMGLLWLEIPDTISETFPLYPDWIQFGVWDLEVTWPSGDVVTYLSGDVYTKGDVTRV